MPYKKGESGNLRGRPSQSIVGRLKARMDGWINMVTALGTGDDKRTHSWFLPDVVTDVEAANLWRGDDICARIIEAQPKAELRRGFSLKLQDKDKAEKVMARLEDLGITSKFTRARMMQRAFGGCGMYPVVDDGASSLLEPLDKTRVNALRAIHLLEPRELSPVTYYNDINDPKFGQPETWRLIPMNAGMMGASMTYIHESRLVIFPGRRVTNQIQVYQRPGWGDSELTGVYPIVRDFGSAWGHVATLLQDFSQGVLKMDGYGDLMATVDGEEVVKARLRVLDMMRSALRMMVVDKNDDFQRQTTPLGGASEILHDMATRISAAARQPVTLLFGMAPAGLNATGDSDIRNWYDTVASDREHELKPRLEHVVGLELASADGIFSGTEPDVWSVDFPPLWEPTEQERAQTRLTVAQTDQIYWNIGAASENDIAESRWKGDTYSAEMIIDWKAREKQQAAAEEMQKQQLAAATAATSAPAPDADPNAPTDPNADKPPAQPKNVAAAQPQERAS